MGKVQLLKTENFQFTIISSEGGVIKLEIKATTKTGKDLFRFKKFGKVLAQTVTPDSIFEYVDSFEEKLQLLASI
jgi:hypothetical protein